MTNGRLPVFALVVFVGMTSVNWSPEDAGIVLADPEVANFHGTKVTPVLGEAMPEGQNVLWCASFQMAWDSAGAKIGRPIRLRPPSKLADALNGSSFDRSWVDEDSVFTTEGRMDDGVLERINEGCLAKSGKPSRLVEKLGKNADPSDLVFYAMLFKDLEFENPFGKLGNWKIGERAVPWFGFSPDQKETGPLLKQVRVHHYAAKNDFVIELLSKPAGDQLLLAKLPELPKSPAEVSRSVLRRLQADAPEARHDDLLAVPNVVVDEEAQFTDLEGRRVEGKELFVRNAYQTVEFRMDEKGVKLRSEGGVSFGCSAEARIEPRLMILDPPFALILKRGDAPQPYFVAWFANADLLGAE